jgi:hypothetical protein
MKKYNKWKFLLGVRSLGSQEPIAKRNIFTIFLDRYRVFFVGVFRLHGCRLFCSALVTD